MEMSKKEAHILYLFCRQFMDENKKIYENTAKCIRYINLIEKTRDEIELLNLEVEKYYLNERNYPNNVINMHIHDKVKSLKDRIDTLNEDIIYYDSIVTSMNVSKDIYLQYLECESDIVRYTKILLA